MLSYLVSWFAMTMVIRLIIECYGEPYLLAIYVT